LSDKGDPKEILSWLSAISEDGEFANRLDEIIEGMRRELKLVKIVPVKHIDAKEIRITKNSDQMSILVVLSDGTEITITTESWTIVDWDSCSVTSNESEKSRG